MNALFGVGLLAVSALFFAWSFGQFRRPHPKSWTRSDFAAIATSLSLVGLLALAVALLINFDAGRLAGSGWLQLAGVAGGGFLLCLLLIPRLVAPAFRSAQPQRSVGLPPMDRLPEPANDPHPTSPSRPQRPSGRRTRRRAA